MRGRVCSVMSLSGVCALTSCCRSRDLSEQIKKVTKEVHVRAESTQLMLSFQRGQVTLQQYKVLESRPHVIGRSHLNSQYLHVSSSSSSSAAAVLAVRDLLGLGGGDGQKL